MSNVRQAISGMAEQYCFLRFDYM